MQNENMIDTPSEEINTDLDPFVEEIPEAAVGLPEAFAVTDEKSASWVIRKIVEARLRASRVQEQLEAELRECKREEDYFLQRFGPQLMQFADAKLSATGYKKKTLRLPDGTLGFRSTPVRLDVQDEEQLFAWARENLRSAMGFQLDVDLDGCTQSDLNRILATFDEIEKPCEIKERVSKTELNRYFKDNGEVPPGCEVVGGEDKFYVK